MKLQVCATLLIYTPVKRPRMSKHITTAPHFPDHFTFRIRSVQECAEVDRLLNSQTSCELPSHVMSLQSLLWLS